MGNFISSSTKSCKESSINCSRKVTHPIVNMILFNPPLISPSGVKYSETTLEKISCNFIYHDENKLVPYKLHTYPGATNYIVFAHGNATDIMQMSEYCKSLSNVTKSNVMTFEYPGYLCSNEKSTEKGCYENMDIIMNFMLNDVKIKKENIFLVGQSLGTGIVIDYASRNNDWDTPILIISPYKSIASVVIDDENSCSSLRTTVDMFESLKKITKIKAPIKIIHGATDNVISIDHGQTLYEKAPVKLPPIWIPNCGHNDILHRITSQIWEDFLKSNTQ